MRRMADPEFRSQQWNSRFEPHIAPINTLVDSLRDKNGRGWLPYVAPIYGGVDAKLLSLSRDPGPMTQEGRGSGFLCCENDDPSAEAMARYYEYSGIRPSEALAWNTYPWYINRPPSPAELDAGVEPLKSLLDLLSKLRVVMLHGRAAQAGWRKFERRHPRYAFDRNLTVIQTFHTSRQALWTPDPAQREFRMRHLHEAFMRAGEIIRSSNDVTNL